jgi:hypothetical protein
MPVSGPAGFLFWRHIVFLAMPSSQRTALTADYSLPAFLCFPLFSTVGHILVMMPIGTKNGTLPVFFGEFRGDF